MCISSFLQDNVLTEAKSSTQKYVLNSNYLILFIQVVNIIFLCLAAVKLDINHCFIHKGKKEYFLD